MASRPSSATSTAWPLAVRAVRTAAEIVGSSSTTRTRRTDAPFRTWQARTRAASGPIVAPSACGVRGSPVACRHRRRDLIHLALMVPAEPRALPNEEVHEQSRSRPTSGFAPWAGLRRASRHADGDDGAGRFAAGGDGRGSGIPPLALLPLRLFLGVTFLYAGLDKLLDPAFLNASGPGSIGAQMVAFAHNSPLGPLVVVVGEPFPVAVGLGISLAEIAVGVGTLTGLLFRASAALGAALSILFWLTASWAVKPYYYGPDLPYAVGWITLALAGTGGMFTIGEWLPALAPGPTAYELDRRRFATSRGRPVPDPAEDMTRRALLEAGLLAGVAILLASVAGVLGPILGGRAEGRSGLTSSGAGASDAPDALAAPDPSAAASAEASAGPARQRRPRRRPARSSAACVTSRTIGPSDSPIR